MNIKHCDIDIAVYFKSYLGINVYFFDYKEVSQKNSVYTYTQLDELKDPSLVHGHGFYDNDEINIIFQIAFTTYVLKYLDPPDILSLHDGHTGLIPALIKSNIEYQEHFKNSKIFFTIHNAGVAYHQRVSLQKLLKCDLWNKSLLDPGTFSGNVDPLCLASLYSNTLTVSPYYAEELLNLYHESSSGEFGRFCRDNKIDIKGIVNGVDLKHYSSLGIDYLPSKKEKKFYRNEVSEILLSIEDVKVWGNISFSNNKPIFLFQNRITEQKGIDKLILSFKEYIKNGGDSIFIVMGEGEDKYEKQLIDLAYSFSDNLCYIQGYKESLAFKLFLSSDFFVLTSIWEPCGLTDFEAQLAGSIPIVHKTGGLKKVENGITGFVYSKFNELSDLLMFCEKEYLKDSILLDNIRKQAYTSILENYTWDNTVLKKYIPLFES